MKHLLLLCTPFSIISIAIGSADCRQIDANKTSTDFIYC